MGVEARRTGGWRARSRSCVALVVVTAWLGTLLVSTATSSSAALAATDDPTITGPALGTDRQPTFAISTVQAGDTPECTFVAGSAAPTAGDWGPCTTGSSYQPSLPATDDDYGIWVRSARTVDVATTVDVPVPDPADSSTTVLSPSPTTSPSTDYSPGTSVTYRLRQGGPSIVRASGPVDGASGAGDARWTFTAEGFAVQCTVTGPVSYSFTGPCDAASTFPAADLPRDGDYSITATAYDGSTALNSSTPLTYTVDTTAPSIVSIVAAASTPADAPRWTVTTDDSTATVSCTLDGRTGWCDPASTLTLPTQGAYTLTVVATDPLGHATTDTSTSYTYDIPPGTPTVTGPVSPGNAKVVSWTVTTQTEGGTFVSCVVTGPGSYSRGAVCNPGTTTFSTDLANAGVYADGLYTLTVTVTDGAGTTVGTADYDFDGTPPTIAVSPKTKATTTATAGWTVTVGAGNAPTCSLTSDTGETLGTGSGCAQFAAPFTLPHPGTYTLTALTADAAGNAVSDVATWIYRAAPTVTVTTAKATGNSTSVSWHVSATTGTTVVCTLTDPDGTPHDYPCTPSSDVPTTVSSTEDVSTFTAVATDPQTSFTGTSSATYLYDNTPPPAFTVTGTSGNRKVVTVDWTWTATAATTACQLRSTSDPLYVPAAFTTCAPDYVQDLPGEGTWQLAVRQTDAAGNATTALSPAARVDLTAPVAPGVSTPKALSNNRSPSWTLTGEAGATFDCSWTAAVGAPLPAAGPCTSPYAPALPATDDVYTLHVVQTDLAGNASPETTKTYQLDLTTPTVTFTQEPTGPSNSTTVTWKTSVSEASAKTECQLVKRTLGIDTVLYPWRTTSCGRTVTENLVNGDGTYVLQVRDTDPAGNVAVNGTSSAPYALDTTGPGAPTVDGPSGDSNVPDVTWTVTPSPTDPGVGFLCRLVKNLDTSGAWVACDTDPVAAGITYSATLTDGTYRLDVVSADALGNRSTPVTSSLDLRLDTKAPAAAVFSGTSGTGKTPSRSWTWTGEGGARNDCRLWAGPSLASLSLVSTTLDCVTGDTEALATPTPGTYYVLKVTLTDAAGNATEAAGPSYLLDTVAPVAPAVDGLSGTDNVTAVQYTFVPSEGGTVAQCQLMQRPLGSAVWTAIQTRASCPTPWAVTLPSVDGDYTARVTSTDAAGNTSVYGESPTYSLDLTGPVAPGFTSGPSGTDNDKTVTWTWTYEAASTGTCTLTHAGAVVVAAAVCNTGTYTTTLASGDGVYALTVALTDQYGNSGGTATSVDYTLDATAPGAPVVSGPAGPSNKTSIDYAIVGPVEALATEECRLTRGSTTVSDWAPCTLPRTVSLGVDGTYVLEVRLTDRYGNLGLPGASQGYVLDTAPPAAPTVSVPASPSSNASPAFGIVTDAGTTTTCRLSRGSVVAIDTTPCGGSFSGSIAGQPDGDYVLSVTATDAAGNTATGASGIYTYDTTKPAAPAVTGPAGPSQLRNPVFSWTGEAGARPECSLQEKAGAAGAWTPCATPYAPTLPSDGSWVLSVRLTDAAGNVGDAGQSGAYVLDTTAPPAPVVTAPTSPGRDLAPSWSAATEDGSRTECRLLGPGQLGTWVGCALPLTTPVTLDGTYTLEVRVTDAAGNVSPAGSGVYTLDTTAPVAPVVTQPTGPGRTRAPSIAFTAESGTAGSCRLTHGATVLSDSAPCASPVTLDLTGLNDGAYTLSVRAVDAAGNIGPAGTATYVLDTTAPSAPTFTLVAGSPSSDRAPVFGFTGESGTTLTCKLTVPSGAVRDLACGSPLTLDLSGATDGDYVLAVRATDPAGNIGPAATTTFTLDSNAPAAPRIVGPPTPGSARNPVWKISSSSPAECRLTRGTTVVRDWAPCGTSYAADLFSQPDGAYVLEARVIGTTAPTSSRYRLDTTGPAAATLVGPPSPSTDRKPTWAVASPDTTVKAECRVMVFTGVLKDWAACAVSPAGSLFTLDLTGLGDGTYTLEVRLTDGAGNVGPSATSDYVLDTSAPAAVGVLGPLSPGNDTTPTWTLTSAAGVKLECRLSSGQTVVSDFAPCAGTFTADLTGLPDGTYTLTVHALSAAGTPGPETTSGYILDTTAAGAPGTLTGPTGPSRDRAPKWTFTLAPGTTATCKVTIGGKVFSDGPCASPFVLDLSNAADGTYTLTVRAVDGAGNLGSPSTAGYILKTTPPPAPVLTMQPGSPSSTTGPRWGFSLFRGTTGQCRLLQAGNPLEDWTACSSPVTALLSGKPDGSYTMQVRAIDVALNTSSVVSGDYTFDRSAAPLAEFLDTPVTPGNDTTPTWVVAAPAAATTPAGTAALLRAAALTGTPQSECRLTTPRGVGAWAPCSGAYTATTNGDGTYLLEVRAFDATGARGPASTSTYLLDTRAPAAPRFLDPVPPPVGNDPEVAWSWAEDDNLVECHLLRSSGALGAFAACAPPYVANVGRLGEATYSIEARAVDAAGNVSPLAVASYRYDITPPPAPVFASRPPTRGASASVGWTFAVPLDASAVCVVTRNSTVISEGACAGAFTLDLRGQQPATWALSVHFVDAAGNVGRSTVGTYALTSAVGGRVNGPSGGGTGNGNGSGPAPGGPGGSGGAPVPGAGPAKTPSGVDALNDHPRAGAVARIPDVIKKGIRSVAHATAGIPGAIPGTDVPAAIKNVLGQTITKPQLPLALFVIVLLFLLVQNRIDRRDPKLAAAPVSAEPELMFGPILRPGGASA
ncbi:MAG: Ig-like domain repeat protein [Frankiales bacterium]|nr:Ig-like domain repeat protein [Frankiales bacterium]